VVNCVSGDLLDTSILIAPDLAALANLPGSAAISVITLGELHAGVLLARDTNLEEARRARLMAVKASFAPLPVDEPIAEHYGKVLALARTERRTVKATDLLIIATAAAHSRTLHTLDGKQASLARAAGISVEIL